MKNQVRKISQDALKSLWDSSSNKSYLNDFYRTETELAREKYGRNFRFLQIFIQ